MHCFSQCDALLTATHCSHGIMMPHVNQAVSALLLCSPTVGAVFTSKEVKKTNRSENCPTLRAVLLNFLESKDSMDIQALSTTK